MIKLTAKQDEYLLYFATMKGQTSAISDIAEYFGVNKSAAFKILNTMCEAGVIEKDEESKVDITPRGTQYIQQAGV